MCWVCSREKGQSLKISIAPDKCGQWLDFATGDKGDIFTLVELAKGMSYCDAVNWLGANFTSLSPRSEIKIKLNTVKDYTVVDPDKDTIPLTDEAAEAISKKRGLPVQVLHDYGVRVASGGKGEVAFLYYLNKECVKIHYVGLRNKTFRSSVNPANVLYGKEYATPEKCSGTLVITEGQWDALAFAAAGIPAVSIPNGVQSHKWIEFDWEYLRQFHTFLISFDQDDAGKKATEEVTKRLGVSKCKIVSLPLKDANDVLRDSELGASALQEAAEQATPYQPEEISPARSLLKSTWELMSVDRNTIGQKIHLDIPFRLREHEFTLFTGFRGHGKSTVVYNLRLFAGTA